MIDKGPRPKDRDLIQQLPTASRFHRVMIAAGRGDAVGNEGPGVLRELLKATGPGNRDLRCASIIALAKRCGADATEDFAVALGSRDAAVRDYAGLAFLRVADGRAWETIFGLLSEKVVRARSKRWSESYEPGMLLDYLTRNCTASSEQANRFVTLIRINWPRLTETEQQWVNEFLSAAAPGGPQPEVVPMREPEPLSEPQWDPLFERL